MRSLPKTLKLSYYLSHEIVSRNNPIFQAFHVIKFSKLNSTLDSYLNDLYHSRIFRFHPLLCLKMTNDARVLWIHANKNQWLATNYPCFSQIFNSLQNQCKHSVPCNSYIRMITPKWVGTKVKDKNFCYPDNSNPWNANKNNIPFCREALFKLY